MSLFTRHSSLPDNVDDTEDETVLASHGEITAMSVARHRVLLSCNAEHSVHLAKGADQIRVGVGCEQD